MKNLLINGNFNVWQKGTTTGSVSTYTGCPDTWNIITDGTLKYSLSQDTDVPPNGRSSYSMKILCTVASSQGCRVYHVVEGYDWRNAAGRELKLSFWVKANKTGTMGIRLDATSYLYTKFVINSADTWEYKTILIPPTSTVLTNWTTGAGFQINFCPALTSSAGIENQWLPSGAGWTGANDTWRALNDYIFLSQVKISVGSQFVENEQEDHEVDLLRCQRRLFRINNTAGNRIRIAGGIIAVSGNQDWISVPLPTTMRALPTITNGTNNLFPVCGATSGTAISFGTSAIGTSINLPFISFGTGGFSPIKACSVFSTNTGGEYIQFASELP